MAKNKQFNGGFATDYYMYYVNKYFNLFMDKYKWTGLDYRERKYVMTKFWDQGTIGAFKIKYLDKLAYAPWVQNTWDIYGECETCTLVNERGSSLIPNNTQVVDKDVVIGWIQSNRKPLKLMVNFYLDRIVNAQTILNTNLNLQKHPYVLAVDETERVKAKNVIDQILNNDIVVALDGIDPNTIQTVLTEAPYLVDKLHTYIMTLENELKTLIGINNQGMEKGQQLQAAEINANNQEVCLHSDGYLENLQDWCRRINEVLGVSIWVEAADLPEIEDVSQYHDGDKPGPKENEDEGDNE